MVFEKSRSNLGNGVIKVGEAFLEEADSFADRYSPRDAKSSIAKLPVQVGSLLIRTGDVILPNQEES